MSFDNPCFGERAASPTDTTEVNRAGFSGGSFL